ncbi:MAG: hypothetical protein LW808_002320 [Verrucomicrobiota bacterium]|nr:MAG: hypothetical protein LW808_002320 [Verrucomicrobiota bacterium]
MKTILMGIGFVMGIFLASSCVFGETSQKRLNEYSGEELKQALSEVMNRLTSAGYQPIPGTLKYKFDAQHTTVGPEGVPLTKQLEDLQKDLDQWGQKIDGAVKDLNAKANKSEKVKDVEKLSEKKRAFIRCVKFKAGLEGATLSEEDRKVPTIKKCLEILGDVETENLLPFYQLSNTLFLFFDKTQGITIQFPDSTEIEIAPNGKTKTMKSPTSEKDDWFDYDEFDAKYGGKNYFAANKSDDNDETDSITGGETGDQSDD